MIRKLFLVFCLLLFTVLTFVILLLVLIDPRDYHPDLASLMMEQTGRDVSILGGVRYEYFPWLGVRANDVRIAQPEGFGKEPFLSLKQISLRVRILPLVFKREIRLDQVEMVGPKLLLRRTPSGRNNWDDILARLSPEETSVDVAPHTPMNFRPFDWQGLSLIQGSIIFMDEQEGERIDLQNLQVRTDPGMEFGYHISYRIKSMRQAASAEVLLHGKCNVALRPFNITLKDTSLHTEVQALRRGRTRLGAIEGIADFDLQRQSIEVKEAKVAFEGLRLGGQVRGENIMGENFSFLGNMHLISLDPQALFDLESGQEDAAPRESGKDDSTLRPLQPILENVSGKTDFSLNANALSLQNLEVLAPGTGLSGGIDIVFPTSEAPAIINLDLTGKGLDIDALLPKSTGSKKNNDSLLPDWFMNWPGEFPRITARLNLARLRYRKTEAMGNTVNFSTAPGKLTLALDASAFAGGTLTASCQTDKGKLTGFGKLRNADATSVSKLLFQRTTFHGPADFSWKFSGKGISRKALRTNLQAEAELRLQKGGFDIALESEPQSPKDWFSLRFTDGKAKLVFSSSGKNPKANNQPFTCTAHVDCKGIEPGGLLGTSKTGKWEGPVDTSWDVQGGFLWDVNKEDLLLIEGAKVSGKYKGPLHPFPERRLDLTVINGKAAYDVDKDVLRVDRIVVELPHLRGQLSGVATTLGRVAKTRYSGTLETASFVPRAALPQFGLTFPESKAAYALQQASLTTAFDITAQNSSFSIQHLKLDKSAITGKMEIMDRDRPGASKWRLNLSADSFNLDDYLPPPEDQKPKTPSNDWDTKWLQGLDLAGQITSGYMRYKNMDFTNVHATVEALQGRLFLRPFRAAFYGGELIGTLQLEAMSKGRGLAVSSEMDIAKFQREPAIQSLGGGDSVGGTASWKMTLAGGGTNWRKLISTLGGSASFKAYDGFYVISRKSAPPPKKRNNAMLSTGKTPQKSGGSERVTRYPFSEAKATFQVNNGVITNNDFLVQGTLIQAKGDGTASMVTRDMDYAILVQMTGAPTIPVYIHGPFSDLKVEIGQTEMLTDTVGRIGGSVFNIFKGVLTLPFKAIDLFDGE